MGAGRAARAVCLLLALGATPALGSDHPDPVAGEARAITAGQRFALAGPEPGSPDGELLRASARARLLLGAVGRSRRPSLEHRSAAPRCAG